MGDPVGAVAFGLHAAHNVINYLKEVEDGSSERENLKFLLRESARSLETIKAAYEQSPREIQVKCAVQHDQVFGAQGTIRAYIRILLELNKKLRDRGFSNRLKSALKKEKSDEMETLDVEDEVQIALLLNSVSDRLKERGFRDKWTFPWKKDDLQKKFQKLEAYMDSFANLRFRVNDAVNIGTLNVTLEVKDVAYETRSSLNENAHQIRKISRHLDGTGITRLLDWLSSEEPWSRVPEELRKCKDSQPAWIQETPSYKQWLTKTSEERALWGVGQYGVGKTMIASYVAWHLRQMQRKHPANIHGRVALFFFNHKQQHQQSLDSILRCLARQLIGDLEGPEDEKRRNLAAHVELLRLNDISTIELLSELLRNLQEVILVLDGMDECGIQVDLIDVLQELLKEHPALRVFITSRPGYFIPEITAKISITAEDDLIRKAVRAELGRRSKGVSKLAQVCMHRRSPESITEVVVRSAAGRFLFADLQLKGLIDCRSEAEVLKRLDQPFMELEEMFEDALLRIKSQPEELLRLRGMRAVLWTLYSKRALTAEELCVVLAFYEKDDDEMLEEIITCDLVVDSTKGLLTLEDNGRALRIHKGFQDYFDGKPDRMKEHFPEADAEIGVRCLMYLSLPAFNSGHCMTEKEWRRRKETHPLLDYAAAHWGHHVQAAGEEAFLGNEPLFPVINFLQDNLRTAAAAQALVQNLGPIMGSFVRPDDIKNWQDPIGKEPLLSGLHLAVGFGLLSVAERLRECGSNIEVRSFWDQTPLHYAVRLGNEAAVQYLLQHGADAAYYDLSDQPTLNTAAFWNWSRLIEPLLDSKPDLLNRKNWWQETALADAVKHGSTDAAKILLRRGADPYCKNAQGISCLGHAAHANHTAMLSPLIGRMKLDVKDTAQFESEKAEALAIAIEKSHLDTVRILLENGANPG